MTNTNDTAYFLGISGTNVDPAVAVVRNGIVIAHAEEERFIRYKHARGVYPSRALKFCLERAGISWRNVRAVATNWDLTAYSNGTVREFFESMRSEWNVDAATKAWQEMVLRRYDIENYNEFHRFQWRQEFGMQDFPPLHAMPHHYVHAVQAYTQSPFEDALCITVDGSGETQCTVLWDCCKDKLQPILEFNMPHSLGWYYAAFTEYLGFKAYDGEYKVMGLAAYGGKNEILRSKIQQILKENEDGVGYSLDPRYVHYGPHTWSGRFTDHLVELLNHPRRLADEPITNWHMDLAYEVQNALELAVCRLVKWGISKTGKPHVCVGGGVGLNVKMNSRIFGLDEVQDLFAHPLCSDSGAASGAALAACWQLTGQRPNRLTSLDLGVEFSDSAIEQVLRVCGLPYSRHANIAEKVASSLARGRIVGWFQGRAEAGPRALGGRSILADPRQESVRDRINSTVKHREPWRPYCPSMLAEDVPLYLRTYTYAPFMNIAFEVTDLMRTNAPAVVHVDGTARVQIVDEGDNPLFHRLLREFKRRTGVSVLLNTSFNIKGEPIVNSVEDAIRTFCSTSMDVLACGTYLVEKPGVC